MGHVKSKFDIAVDQLGSLYEQTQALKVIVKEEASESLEVFRQAMLRGEFDAVAPNLLMERFEPQWGNYTHYLGNVIKPIEWYIETLQDAEQSSEEKINALRHIQDLAPAVRKQFAEACVALHNEMTTERSSLIREDEKPDAATKVEALEKSWKNAAELADAMEATVAAAGINPARAAERMQA